MTRHLVLTGMPAVGKSTVGAGVADRLGWRWRDSDRDIERLTGRTGRTIADEDGVGMLHDWEATVLLGALADDGPSVVSAAGSVIEDARVRQVLAHLAVDRRAVLVVLRLPSVAVRAVGDASEGHRRAIDVEDYLALQADRMPLWAAHAARIVEVTDRSGVWRDPSEIGSQVLHAARLG